MAVQRHSPAVPEAELRPRFCQEPQERTYPEPACMWLQGDIPSSDPVAVETGPLPSPYRRTSLRTRTPAKNVRVATLPQPHIAAPTQLGGSRNPVAPPSMNVELQALGEVSGDIASRAPIKCHRRKA